MVTKQIAMTTYGFFHVSLRNADGSAVRCRANGKCKTWKTRPDDFRLPVKYGLKECFYITPRNAADWSAIDPLAERLCPVCGVRVALTGRTTDGRVIGSCGDAFSFEKWCE